MDKCLAFCQALATSNQKFTFSLTIGKDSFSFDNKELVSSSWQKKKKSPSQLRREAKRKEERASKAAVEATGVGNTTEEVVEIISEPVVKDKPRGEASNLKFKCDQCHYLSVSAKGLSQHIRVKHRVAQVNGAVDTVSDNKESGGKHVGEAAEGAASSPPFPEPVMVPCKLGNCKKKFELETDLEDHIICHHIACPVCKEVFKNYTKLNSHQVSLHNIEYRDKDYYLKYRCKRCQERMGKKEEITT